MSPRSILKRASPQTVASTSTSTHAVHFPPSPSLCRTFAAYSSTMYDRTPIVVDKNTCALPERGCPGRTYVLEEQQSRQHSSRSASYHPRALSSATQYRPVDSEYSRASLRDLPQLVPDLSSSESDESDGLSSSPSMPQYLYSYGANGLPAKYEQHDYDSYSKNNIDAISFLPYPPSPPASYNCNSNSDAQSPKPRKKRSSSRSRQDGATDPDRIRRGVSPSKSSRRREYLLSNCGGFGMQDDGCLGGF